MIARELHYSREPRPPPLPERRSGDDNDMGEYLTQDSGHDLYTDVTNAPSYLSVISGGYSDVRASSTMDDSYLKPVTDNDMYLEPVTDNDKSTYLTIG